jgi:hypothetical protein
VGRAFGCHALAWALVVASAPLWIPAAALVDALRKSGGVALRSGCCVAFYLCCELVGLLLGAALWLARPFARWDAERWRALHYRLQDGWGTALFRGRRPMSERGGSAVGPR